MSREKAAAPGDAEASVPPARNESASATQRGQRELSLWPFMLRVPSPLREGAHGFCAETWVSAVSQALATEDKSVVMLGGSSFNMPRMGRPLYDA